MSRVFKNIAKHLMMETGVEIVRGYVIERMRLVTPDDLYKAIRDQTHTLSVAETKDKNFGQKWAKIIERYSFDGKQLHREMMTPENVFAWLKEDRADLASLILNMGEEGQEWLRVDVDELFKFLFPESKPPLKMAIKLVKPTIAAPPAPALTQQENQQPEPNETCEPSETPKS